MLGFENKTKSFRWLVIAVVCVLAFSAYSTFTATPDQNSLPEISNYDSENVDGTIQGNQLGNYLNYHQ